MCAEELCPVRETIKLVGKKWFLIIIFELTKGEGKKGFNELKAAVKGISAKVLSESLRKLADKGVVKRTVHSESPIRVEYSLTEKGRDLKTVFDNMYSWGTKWQVCDDESISKNY